MKHILTLSALAAASSQAAIVGSFATDWLNADVTTGGITSSAPTYTGFSGKAFETAGGASDHTFVNVASAHGLTGQWIYATNTDGLTFTAAITLSNVPAFTSVSVDQLVLGAGGGIDGGQNDGLSVTVNGSPLVTAIVDGRNRDGGYYGGNAPAGAILQGAASTDTDGSEFFNARTDGWGHDSLYDLGQDPAFDDVAIAGAGNVTIVVTGNLTDGAGGAEIGADEQIGVANFGLSFNAIPEPSAALLGALGMLALLGRRRA